MAVIHELRTDRLVLRGWRDSDRQPFAEMNADPIVMQYFPKPFTRRESDDALDRMRDHFARHGFGLWAVEVPGLADLAGFVGLNRPGFTAHFTPCVEIGWRLARAHWGSGYATEGACAALCFAFDRLRLEAIVSFTAPANQRSRRVMEKLGLHHDPADDFDHPGLPETEPLRRHVLYRIHAIEWSHLRSAGPRPRT